MEKSKYHLNGFYQGIFKQNDDLSSILLAINNIHVNKIKPGFVLQQKYKNSKDFRPGITTYENAFLDILFSNEIPTLLKNVVGRELYLAHVQLRISYPGRSYMTWHRDTHAYGDQIVGNIPPVHKIIFYPTVDGQEDEKLCMIPGSHRQVFQNKYLDYLHIFLSKKMKIKSSNTKFLLFNTELFHHVIPETRTKGSFRLIYSFAEKEQLKNYENGKSLINAYQEKLRDSPRRSFQETNNPNS